MLYRVIQDFARNPKMLKNFSPRLYQQTIFSTAAKHNTLVVLPTGMGKTNVALMLAVQRLKQYPQSKVLILAPTRPLLDQHYNTFLLYSELSEDKFQVLSGSVSPDKRKKIWEEKQIFFSTPQTIENDLISGKIKLEDVSLIVFDECHRATGSYSYVFISKCYDKQGKYSRVLGLTASPGSDMDKINEVLDNLAIEKIEVRTDKDSDVAPYIQDVETRYEYVNLPEEFLIIIKCLKLSLTEKLKSIKELGYVNRTEIRSKKELLALQGALQGELARHGTNFDVLKCLSYAAEAVKIEHAIELAETQGLTPLLVYFQKIYDDAKTSKTKAVQNLSKDPNFRVAYIKTKEAIVKFEHPKMDKLKEIVENTMTPDKKMIIFTQYRDSGAKIDEQISRIKGISSRLFVGQSTKKHSGMSQKEQLQTLEDFRNGIYNILIMTSVGEEGLDIPQVNTVLFYEPIPSAIRSVQRRGRTGRSSSGNVIVLLSKGTRDEGYRWSAHHKEKRMLRNLDKIKKQLETKVQTPAKSLQDYYEKKSTSEIEEEKTSSPLKIYVDHREKGNQIVRHLAEQDFIVENQKLDVGDYLLSKDVAVEYKTVKDFVDSLVDGRLLSQLKRIKSAFRKPLVIIEGEEDLYSVRNVHPNAIRGMLATIAISYGIPILQTKSSEETAHIMSAIAKREQKDSSSILQEHTSKPVTLKRQQEYFISSLPNLGTNIARLLLREFKTVKNIVNASEEDLKVIENLGSQKAKQIKDLFESEYD